MKKYEKVFRRDYRQWRRENRAYRERVAADKNRLAYHLMPETGWLNDPNGLCQVDGVYHIYYQYTPFEPTGELKLWGHCTTRDFIHYQSWEPALYPDQDFDAHGVYSGSAFPEQGVIHYFYTGNVKLFDRDDYDYILAGRGSNTVHFTSRDGFRFSEKELLMTTQDYPADISCHVRDPKIILHDSTYYMVLGARDKAGKGLVLLYRSGDLQNWEYHGRITTREPFGYMWECPDLFWLDGRLCLICCPQGVPARGVDFANVHQCTVIPLDYDFSGGSFVVEDSGELRMVDRGFDFYAPQTFLDERGRRILIGWMGIPDAGYTNPTVEAGWQHALTIPRELHMRDGRLIQQPVKELRALRKNRREYSGEELGGAGEQGLVYELNVKFSRCESMELALRDGASLTWENGLLTLDIEACGSGRDRRSVKLADLRKLQVFSDTSSLEIFVNGGEEVFTTRVYGQKGGIRISGECGARAELYDLEGFSWESMEEK